MCLIDLQPYVRWDRLTVRFGPLVLLFFLTLGGSAGGASPEKQTGAGSNLGFQLAQAICPDSGRRIAATIGAVMYPPDAGPSGQVATREPRVVLTAYSASGDEEWTLIVPGYRPNATPFLFCPADGLVRLVLSGVSITKQPDYANPDIFALEITQAGEILGATRVGGTGKEELGGAALSRDGSLVLAGITESADFPVLPRSFLGKPSGPDRGKEAIFVIRLAQGELRASALVKSDRAPCGDHSFWPFLAVKVLGSRVSGLVVESDGTVWITGLAWPCDFPLTVPAAERALSSGTFLAGFTHDLTAVNFAALLSHGPLPSAVYPPQMVLRRPGELALAAASHPGGVEFAAFSTVSRTFTAQNGLNETFGLSWLVADGTGRLFAVVSRSNPSDGSPPVVTPARAHCWTSMRSYGRQIIGWSCRPGGCSPRVPIGCGIACMVQRRSGFCATSHFRGPGFCGQASWPMT